MEKFSIIIDEIYGYKRIDPIPSKEVLNSFYEQKYYELMKKKNNGSIDKLLSENTNKIDEMNWLRKTYDLDSLRIFNKYITSKKPTLLDIGCGTGEMLKFFQENGYEVVGIEPSKLATDIAINESFDVFNTDFDSFFETNTKKFDAINLSNVLEHIPYPDRVIKKCYDILNKNGILRIKVPNDFNELQLIANNLYELNKWWICFPDHVNYFDFNSLENLLQKCNFSIQYKTTDFPMELFLLMGDNYVSNSLVGSQCHKKRVNFELSLPEELRKKIYDSFCEIGIGREVIMYATKIKD